MEPVLPRIICETGASHRQSYARCIALIDAARKVGADAVKFSLFKPHEMTMKSEDPPFLIQNGPWTGSLYNLYEKSSLCYDWIPDLKTAAKACNLDFIVSVYHPDTVPLLDRLCIREVKIASFEITYLDLLGEISKSNVKKVILSTGGADLDEIATAVEMLSNKDLTLLYCVSSYPAKEDDMNLLTMKDLMRFDCPVGLSDHSTGLTAPVAATVMGASVIEKHIKLDDDGLDSSFAVFPDRFAAMVVACRQAKKMLGKVDYPGKKTYHRAEIDGVMLRKVWA